MYTFAPALNVKALTCIAAMAACAILSAPLQAKEHIVAVKISVSTAGLDLSQPADARELYDRLQQAANIVCGHSMRVDLQAAGNFAACYEQALGDSVRSVNRPQLTMVYLQTHTLQNMADRGIDPPALLAAK